MHNKLSLITGTLVILNSIATAAEGAPAKPQGAAKTAAHAKTAAAAKSSDPINDYVKMVSPKVQKAWKAPETTTADKVVVSLTIKNDGTISKIEIKEPSGDQAFDDATVASIKTVGKLPPMPASAKDGMTLEYTFHAGSHNQSTKNDNEAYIKAFSRKITSKWHNPKVDKDYEVTVAITADKTGKLVKAALVKTSGSKIVDEAGLSAAKLAEPYPPIPDSLSEQITINYTFRAGPTKDTVNKMMFNGVPLPQGDYKISSGGAQLKPLDVDTAVNRKLQEREDLMTERMLNLRGKLAQEVAKSGATTIPAAKLQHEIGNCAVELHQYNDAESAYKTALPIVEADSAQSVELQSLLNDYAQMYVATARLKDAEPLLSRACQLAQESTESDEKNKRLVMENYARLLYKLNKTQQADEIYKQLRAKP